MNQKILFEIKKFSCPPVFFTDRKKIVDLDQTIKNLPKNSIIIIREYDLDRKNREIFAEEIIKLARPQGLKVMVGKDISLAKKIKADGIHFSDFDKLPLQFFKKKSFPEKFIFSLSCHSLKSVLKSLKLKPEMIFISPVFSTTSHVGAKTLGLINLAKITFKTRNALYKPSKLFALGGVNSRNIIGLRKLNLSGFGAIDLFKNNI